ncbi:hypothetical protein GCM10010199_46320 [Dactylosporangium roseum]
MFAGGEQHVEVVVGQQGIQSTSERQVHSEVFLSGAGVTSVRSGCTVSPYRTTGQPLKGRPVEWLTNSIAAGTLQPSFQGVNVLVMAPRGARPSDADARPIDRPQWRIVQIGET